MRSTIGLFSIAVVLGAASAGAQAPAPFDARWTPYLGCWRLVQETAISPGGGPPVTVCVRPSGVTAGVTMTTLADGKQILEQTVVADAAAHAIAEAGCNGTQTSEWSKDGFRLFTHVALACNDRPAQALTGLTLFAQGPAWIDIQATAGNQPQVRIRRYVRTSDQPGTLAALPPESATRSAIDAQAASARRLTQEDVAEASSKVASPVVEAAIVETQSRFALDSRALRQLAAAGVPSNVIDLMVAQSFPSHFGVERPVTLPYPSSAASAVQSSTVIGSAQYPVPYPFYSYGAYDPYYYSYFYSPFAYPYYWGNGRYFGGPTYYISNGNTIVVPAGGVYGGTVNGNTTPGQVVNGRGYTRVRPASGGTAVSSSGSSGSSSSGASDSGNSSGSSGSSNSSGSSSSSGGSVSGGGYSNGGESTGRTAQPR